MAARDPTTRDPAPMGMLVPPPDCQKRSGRDPAIVGRYDPAICSFVSNSVLPGFRLRGSRSPVILDRAAQKTSAFRACRESRGLIFPHFFYVLFPFSEL